MLRSKCQTTCVALLAASLLLPGSVWALGLGEIEVDSALNEKFSGTIELLDAGGLQPSEIIISMASREDFDRVGVERFFFLTTISFEVRSIGGAPTVVVSSSQPISEPYIDFIVEVRWPNGRLLKEFTVLLDPPTFTEAAAAPVTAPSQAVTQASDEPQTSAPSPSVTRQTTRPSAGPRPSRFAGDGLMTTRDDTLWKIAERTLPSDRVTVNQQMLAIQRLNREAFIRDNINLLKAGYRLQLPDESQALSLSKNEASLAVADQTNAWREGTGSNQAIASSPSTPATELLDESGEPLRSPIDATRQQTQQPTQTTNGEGQVRIVASTGEAASASGGGTDVEVNQLIEEKATLNRQVDELTYQLDREKEIAANQVSVKDRQLEVKDQELAAMQEEMRQVREQLAEASKNQNQSAATAAPQPWYLSPLFFGSVIGLLILLLAAMLFALRRSRADAEALSDALDAGAPDAPDTALYVEAAQEDQDDYTEVDDRDDSTEQVEPTIGAVTAVHEHEDLLDDVDDEDADDNTAVMESEEDAQTGDVIGEADIYVAYQRYGQAANLLLGALNNEPDRYDIRLKLLEVFVEAEDETQFTEHANYIVENCDDEDVLMACRELESQLQSSRVNLEEDVATLDDASAETQSTSDDTGGLDFELGGIEGLEDGAGESAASSADALADAVDDAGEFELEFDDDTAESVDKAAEAADAAEPVLNAGDDLGGDLGLDFDPERDVAEAEEGFELDIETDDLDIEAELDDADADVAEAPVTEASVDVSAGGEDVAEAVVDGDDFDFEGNGDADINATKIDLAEAYIDMGDSDGARDILQEVADEGTPDQQETARKMLADISG